MQMKNKRLQFNLQIVFLKEEVNGIYKRSMFKEEIINYWNKRINNNFSIIIIIVMSYKIIIDLKVEVGIHLEVLFIIIILIKLRITTIIIKPI